MPVQCLDVLYIFIQGANMSLCFCFIENKCPKKEIIKSFLHLFILAKFDRLSRNFCLILSVLIRWRKTGLTV